jgi:hypothetical protein
LGVHDQFESGGGQSYVFAPPTLFGFFLEKSVVHIIIA